MSCTTDRFIITKGKDNEFVFTIKQDGTTLPMIIDVSDTFSADLVKLDDGTTAVTKALTIEDANSGKVKLTLTSAEVSGLVVEKGDKVDRYYHKPTYKLLLDCNTLNNGNFIAKICEIYVD